MFSTHTNILYIIFPTQPKLLVIKHVFQYQLAKVDQWKTAVTFAPTCFTNCKVDQTFLRNCSSPTFKHTQTHILTHTHTHTHAWISGSLTVILVMFYYMFLHFVF